MNKNVVKQLTKKGCIVGKDAAESITEDDAETIQSLDTTPMYISMDMLQKIRTNGQSQDLKPNGGVPDETVDPEQLEEIDEEENKTSEKEAEEVVEEKNNDSETEQITEQENEETKDETEVETVDDLASQDVEIRDTRDKKEFRTKVEILDDREVTKEEKDVPEFLKYYNDRYEKMRKLLMRRMELKSATTLNRLERRKEGEEATTIGMVKDKYSTNSGKWIVNLEDKTGEFKALVGEREGERIVPDEVIGIIGSMGGDIIYADSIIRADLPIPQGMNTTEEDVEAAYISDLHLGSQDTRHDKFDDFADWLKTKDAEKVGYIVIPGDIVEGVGIYPGQEEELEVTDIYKQYKLFEDWVEKVPERVQIILGPGNHDITRLAEPQPRLPKKAFPEIYDYDNIHFVQNPQTVRLHGIRSKGIKNLMYHGYSFDEHADQIQELREKAYDEPDHLMIDLLKRRHLAPMYGSNALSPEPEDSMVIERKPDVFVSGHFHSHAVQNYKGATVINASSFQAQTDFQKRMGHEPDPGKVTLVNYKTRDTRVKKFF